MDIFFLDYRDPLFSIIMFFVIIFVISLASYSWGVYKQGESKEHIDNFLKKFDIRAKKDEYENFLKSIDFSSSSWKLIADGYTKNGEFERAIDLYLLGLSCAKNAREKCFILPELGFVYFKAGFLKRSMEVFLQSLSLAPRDAKSLQMLCVCAEKLQDYKLALECMDSLGELDLDVRGQKNYLLAKKCLEDFKLNKNQCLKNLEKLSLQTPLIKRMIIEYKAQDLCKNDFEGIEQRHVIDILWKLDIHLLKELQSELARAILAIRTNEHVDIKSDILELEILLNLTNHDYHKATLGFEYVCHECQNAFPVFFYRCPACHGLESCDIQTQLIRTEHEKNISFL